MQAANVKLRQSKTTSHLEKYDKKLEKVDIVVFQGHFVFRPQALLKGPKRSFVVVVLVVLGVESSSKNVINRVCPCMAFVVLYGLVAFHDIGHVWPYLA